MQVVKQRPTDQLVTTYSATTASTLPPAVGWGWAPVLSVVGAFGLLFVAIADTAARHSLPWAELLFWSGLVVLYAPPVARLAMPGPSRSERLALLLLLGGGLYLVKVLHSPIGFTHHDEFLHWRTAQDILESGRLFSENPLLPVSPLYPGLELVTTALINVGGLPSIFAAGVVVVGVARLIVVTALFLFYERLTGSGRIAGFAVAVYMTNPTFLFFGGLFKYESLALAFLALALAALARREQAGNVSARVGLTIVALVALTVVAATHHLTSYALVGLLALWLVVALVRRRRGEAARLTGLVAVAIIVNVSWLLYVAGITVGYLAPLFITALIELVSLISREPGMSRELFTSNTGEVAPLWQRLTALGAVGLLLLALPFGLFEAWRRYRERTAVLMLALLALLYPTTLILRLVSDSWEISHRSSVIVFLALGLLVALAVTEYWLIRSQRRLATIPVALAASIMLVGGVIAGWPPKWHLPGPYLVSAATRSIEPQGLEAAFWMRNWLGPDNRITTDGTNYMLMGSYGEQHYVFTLNGGVDSSWVFYAPKLGPGEIGILRRGRIRYIVVDRRLTTNIPMLSPYSGDDPRGKNLRGPVPTEVLEKFDDVPRLDRLFDSGGIVIYDTGELIGER